MSWLEVRGSFQLHYRTLGQHSCWQTVGNKPQNARRASMTSSALEKLSPWIQKEGHYSKCCRPFLRNRFQFIFSTLHARAGWDNRLLVSVQ
jgi:hypothetical protein